MNTFPVYLFAIAIAFSAWICGLCMSNMDTIIVSNFRLQTEDRVSSKYLLWSYTRKRRLQCAADCSRDRRCRAYFYNSITHVCQGHSSAPSDDLQVTETGWKLYSGKEQTLFINREQAGWFGQEDLVRTPPGSKSVVE